MLLSDQLYIRSGTSSRSLRFTGNRLQRDNVRPLKSTGLELPGKLRYDIPATRGSRTPQSFSERKLNGPRDGRLACFSRWRWWRFVGTFSRGSAR
jgi:hypothetical protein